MAQLKVYTASAGSGKTHSLTKEYLSLVLKEQSPLAFKGIQAVTFTNKATEEMKSRILEELYLISLNGQGGNESAFFEELKKELHCSEEELQRRAKKVLNAILQDYSSFRIKTIDSFFQEVLRNLARELGLQGNFRPLVETTQIFEQAVLGILTDLDNPNVKEADKTIVKQLVKNLVQSLVQEGKSSDPRKEIRKLVSELGREEVQLFQEEGLLMNPDELKKYKEYCFNERKRLITQLKDIADDVIKPLLELGLFNENFESKQISNNRKGGFAPFVKLYERPINQLLKDFEGIDLLPSRFMTALDDYETLLGTKFRASYSEVLLNSGIPSKMQEYYSLASSGKILTLKLILDFIDSYSFILKIDEKVKELQKEDNVILLKDTSRLINQMLKDKSGVYFLYEKLGTRILHHMIDEFQDTSRLQYENFKPLLEESLSNNNMSLVVGDVKQSIYRFRNSDSSLLRKDIIQDFGSEVEQINLGSNWRSEAEIINFNNALYEQLPIYISNSFEEKIKGLKDVDIKLSPEIFQDYYAKAEVEQAVGRKGAGGLVVVYPHEDKKSNKTSSSEDEECPSLVPPNFIETIANLQKRGYKPSDIAILVRRKKEAGLIAEALGLEQEKQTNQQDAVSYDFVSSEALELQNAQSIQFLIKVLSYIVNPSSKLCRLQLRESYQVLKQGQMENALLFEEDSLELETLRKFGYRGLYEALELIFEHYKDIIPKSEVAYQIKFLDLAFSFQQNYTANISDFLKMYEERGAMQTIVSPEDEQKLILMTAHKSKGLGFPVVLIPFASWTVTPKSSAFMNNILWADAPYLNEIGLNEVKKIPIRYSSKLEKSLFAGGMYEEQIRTALDELNLLYVATTRAKKELHLWYPEVKQEGTIAYWLNTYFNQNQEGYLTFDYKKGYEEQGIVKQNTSIDSEDTEINSSSIQIEQLESFAINERIAVLRQGLEHFEEDNPRLYGNMMHHILSNVITIDDVEKAVDSAVAQGFLVLNEANKTKKAITDWLHSLGDYGRWFDGSAKVLNERAILGGTEGLRRPDRVLIYDEGQKVEIVDYKFGKYSGRSHSKYVKQLEGYRLLLEEMGYKNVISYIWYVREGLIKELKY